jgi:hypothetical protein
MNKNRCNISVVCSLFFLFWMVTKENMDFSHRGTPVTPDLPEHYTNKRYVDQMIAGIAGRSPAVKLSCNA